MKNKKKKKKEIIVFDAKRDNNGRGISAKKIIKLLDVVENELDKLFYSCKIG